MRLRRWQGAEKVITSFCFAVSAGSAGSGSKLQKFRPHHPFVIFWGGGGRSGTAVADIAVTQVDILIELAPTLTGIVIVKGGHKLFVTVAAAVDLRNGQYLLTGDQNGIGTALFRLFDEFGGHLFAGNLLIVTGDGGPSEDGIGLSDSGGIGIKLNFFGRFSGFFAIVLIGETAADKKKGQQYGSGFAYLFHIFRDPGCFVKFLFLRHIGGVPFALPDKI